MNKLVKKIIATVCSGIVFGLAILVMTNNFTSTKVSCDYPSFNSIEQITQASNLIVNGIIISDNGTSTIDAGAGEMKYKTFDLKVTKCIKGTIDSGEIVPIKILETTNDDMNSILLDGNEYICFLQSYDNNIPASLLNMGQSSILIKDNHLVLSDGEKLMLKNINNRTADSIIKNNNTFEQHDTLYVTKDELVNTIEFFIN